LASFSLMVAVVIWREWESGWRLWR
jgi:hypothetical protein